jgi:oligopeptide/dipeptide ABC transporter ATP-binding protein
VAYLCVGGIDRADRIACVSSLHSRPRSRAAGYRLTKFARERIHGDFLRTEARDPYNQALQKSIPALHEKGETLHTIPGSPPDLSKPISGCPFAPRCEFAQEKCVTSTIALKEIADGHFSACLRIQLKEIDLTPAHLPERRSRVK